MTGGLIDIGGKDESQRTAVGRGIIDVGTTGFEALRAGRSKKGDALEVARIAAVMAAKNTPQIIPLCHPILLESVSVDFEMDAKKTSVSATVRVTSHGKTGVEMEALCGAAAACLAIYDMLKYTGKAMTIREVCLLEKTGGRHGDYKRQD